MNKHPKKLMLLGSGELGKEVAIAAKRLGCEVIACDRYNNAPAMQVSDRDEVIDMTNGEELKKTVLKHCPDLIIPEIEALNVDTLEDLEKDGFNIIPTARATSITMNRDKVRELASKALKIETAKYDYASNIKELKEKSKSIGFPLIIKPIMSSSGKGQSLVKNEEDLDKSWTKAMEGARGISQNIILEEFINFELEITLLTIRQKSGKTLFCPPIGHQQVNGDYQCSWQPAVLTKEQLLKAESIAKQITDELGGIGLFGVEFFICGDKVIFSELSPRPHDTGLVTLISQNLSEFELHVRAILEIPIPSIYIKDFCASRVILAQNDISNVEYIGLDRALEKENTQVFIFGKPTAKKGRRMGVALAMGETLIEAQAKADSAAESIKVIEK